MTWTNGFLRDNQAIDDILRSRACMVCSECGGSGILACITEEERVCYCPQCKAMTTQLSKEKWIGKEKK